MLRRCTLTLAWWATAAFGQEATLGRVEIVGSRVPRIDAETALPVQVIRREEIERSGVNTVEELLERVSANVGGHREAMGLGDADTPGFSGASLRGLGAAETLVLLNGRRLANYAFSGLGGQGVDLHVIPLAAIDRVEILKDGASALYGSDAIGGVINFVTRKDYAGAEAAIRYSRPEAGGGQRTRATLSAGRGDMAADGFNLFAVLDVQDAQRLRAVDRPYAASAYHPELGLDSTQATSWPANIRIISNGRIVGLVNPLAPQCTELTVNKGRACYFDFVKTIDLLPPSQQLNLLGRGTLRLGAETEGYAEVLASSSRIEFHASPSPAVPSTTQGGAVFRLPASSPYYPTELGLSGDLSLAYRTAPLGGRTSEVRSDNARVLAGIHSRQAVWDLDGAVIVNDSRARESYASGFVDAGRLSAAIASGLVNPFGASAPEGEALLAATQLRGRSRTAVGRSQSADLRASRDLLDLAGGPLAIATGAEARHENLRDTQSALVADVIGGVPSAPKEGARTAQAMFVEVVAPLTKGFEVQAAARLDHYSDFGTSVNPKVAVRLQPAQGLLVRASVGRGFRAPSLPELYTQQSSGFIESTVSGLVDPVRCPVTGLEVDCEPNVLATSGGNPRLRPQRSTQASAGIVAEPARNWMVSLDLWTIRVSDIIGTLSFDDVVGNLSRYEGRNVIRGPVDPAFADLPGPIVGIQTLNENLGDWRVSGADLSIALRPVPTPVGRFSATLDGTYVQRARQNIFVGNEVDLIGRVVPRWQHVLTFNLDHAPVTGTVSQRYRRGYVTHRPLPDGTFYRVGSNRVWDGQIAVAAFDRVRLTLGVRNLFDTRPPFSNSLASFQVGYDPVYADPLGRTWTVGLSAAWR